MNIFFTVVFSLLAAHSFSQDFNWAKSIGGNSGDNPRDLAVSTNGQSFTVGGFLGTRDFDPGVNVVNVSSTGSGEDAYIVSLDASGSFLWVRTFETSLTSRIQHVAVNASGIYVLGFYQGSMDTDPGAGVQFISTAGLDDFFLIKLDLSGNFIWSKNFGGSGYDFSLDLSLDNQGNVLYTAIFEDTVDFDPGPGVFNLIAQSSSDGVVACLDAAGDFQWASALHGFGSGLINDQYLTSDTAGNVYVAGEFSGQVDFDPGTSVSTLSSGSISNFDVFFLKLDATGAFQWVKKIGNSGNNETAKDIKVNGSDQVYFCGTFIGTVDFDPSAGVQNLTTAGSNAAYLSKWDTNGNLTWAEMIVNPVGYSEPKTLAIDLLGNVYTAGYYTESADLDPGPGTLNVTATSAAFNEIFMSKVDEQGDLIWAHSLGGIYSDAILGFDLDQYNNVYVAGDFWDTVDFDPSPGTSNLTSAGSYDIFIAKFNQCAPQFATDIQVSCGPYLWIDGNTYAASTNSPTVTIPASSGCDSTITLHLTVNQPTNSSDSVASCGPYFWSISGMTYATAGTYTDTLQNAVGCDSIITLQLDVLPVLNAVIFNLDNTLFTQDTGFVYQWIDCNTNLPIPGETGTVFSPTLNGEYALVVDNGGCQDTSVCIAVSTIGLDESMVQRLQVYPNPAKDVITLTNQGVEIGSLRLTNAVGEMVWEGMIPTSNFEFQVKELPTGMYLWKTETEVLRFIKQ